MEPSSSKDWVLSQDDSLGKGVTVKKPKKPPKVEQQVGYLMLAYKFCVKLI